MDLFSELLKDAFRVFIRVVSAYMLQKLLFKNAKTTRRRDKQMGSSRKK